MSTKSPACRASDPNVCAVKIEVSAEQSILLTFDQFAFAELRSEGKEQLLRLVFATHEVTLPGHSLRRIETTMQGMELSFLDGAARQAAGDRSRWPTSRSRNRRGGIQTTKPTGHRTFTVNAAWLLNLPMCPSGSDGAGSLVWLFCSRSHCHNPRNEHANGESRAPGRKPERRR